MVASNTFAKTAAAAGVGGAAAAAAGAGGLKLKMEGAGLLSSQSSPSCFASPCAFLKAAARIDEYAAENVHQTSDCVRDDVQKFIDFINEGSAKYAAGDEKYRTELNAETPIPKLRKPEENLRKTHNASCGHYVLQSEASDGKRYFLKQIDRTHPDLLHSDANVVNSLNDERSEVRNTLRVLDRLRAGSTAAVDFSAGCLCKDEDRRVHVFLGKRSRAVKIPDGSGSWRQATLTNVVRQKTKDADSFETPRKPKRAVPKVDGFGSEQLQEGELVQLYVTPKGGAREEVVPDVEVHEVGDYLYFDREKVVTDHGDRPCPFGYADRSAAHTAGVRVPKLLKFWRDVRQCGREYDYLLFECEEAGDTAFQKEQAAREDEEKSGGKWEADAAWHTFSSHTRPVDRAAAYICQEHFKDQYGIIQQDTQLGMPWARNRSFEQQTGDFPEGVDYFVMLDWGRVRFDGDWTESDDRVQKLLDHEGMLTHVDITETKCGRVPATSVKPPRGVDGGSPGAGYVPGHLQRCMSTEGAFGTCVKARRSRLFASPTPMPLGRLDEEEEDDSVDRLVKDRITAESSPRCSPSPYGSAMSQSRSYSTTALRAISGLGHGRGSPSTRSPISHLGRSLCRDSPPASPGAGAGFGHRGSTSRASVTPNQNRCTQLASFGSTLQEQSGGRSGSSGGSPTRSRRRVGQTPDLDNEGGSPQRSCSPFLQTMGTLLLGSAAKGSPGTGVRTTSAAGTTLKSLADEFTDLGGDE